MSASDGRRDDGGFSLIEVLIASALMSLIGLLVMTTVVSGLRTSARGAARVDDVAQGQRAMRILTTDLRAARSFVEVNDRKLRFFTSAFPTMVCPSGSPGAITCPVPAPERVTYEVTDAHTLVQTREKGTGALDVNWVATSSSTSTLATAVLLPAEAGRAVFTALSSTDSMRQCPNGPTTGTLGATVTGEDLRRVYAVDVWLSINSANNINRPVTVPGGAVVVGGADLKLDDGYVPSAGIGQGCA